MKIMLCCLLLATLFHPGQLTNQSTQSFRIIPIQKGEHGYSNFESIVLMSKKDLDSFLTDTSTQIGWNNRQEFEDALLNAKLDFSKEALVLLRHSEGSESVKVTFETPILQDRNLLCEIRGRPIPPGYGGTADMAYYCFAVAVSKAQVSQVELQASKAVFPHAVSLRSFYPLLKGNQRTTCCSCRSKRIRSKIAQQSASLARSGPRRKHAD